MHHDSHSAAIVILRWEEHHNDYYATSRIVMDALKMLPNLRSVQFCFFGRPKIPLELDSLKSLDEIIISMAETYLDVIFDNLAKAIAQNPGLKSIEISNVYFERQNLYQSMHHLFKYYPQTAPPLRLLNLKLKSFNLRLDDMTVMRHLIHLKSLSLEKIGSDCGYGPPLYYASRLKDVWQALRVN